ncbi:PAS domain S-box protein [Myxosarcina sp. GI1]|uniref:PAS domain S-box protein n=1 Tax=Myxosarcina sp. GI1 TaxID=1541065 RepID=UPI00068AAD44|nr:PAS domain S-box protein [Myxosarcina sp. GI1]
MTNKFALWQKLKSTRNCDIKLRYVSIALPILVIVVACVVLLGWYLDLPALKSIFLGRSTMKFSTALCFILNSTSLLLWHRQQFARLDRTSRVSNLLISGFLYLVPTLTIVFTTMTLVEYGFQVDLGTNLLSFLDTLNAVGDNFGGRMSPNTALSFFWFSWATILLIQKYYHAVQLLAVAIIGVALTSLMGHIYDLAWFYGMNTGTEIAVVTVFNFLFLAFALLGTHADKALMRIITRNEAGGLMARWLLPLVTIIPPLLGWFFWSNFLDIDVVTETRIALTTLLEISILDAVVLWTAKKLNEIDRQRQSFFQDLEESEQQLSLAFDCAVIGKALLSIEGKFLKVNPALCEIVGYSKRELLNLKFQDITYAEDLANLEYRNRMLAGEINTHQIEKRYIHKLGHLVWVSISVSLVRDRQNREPLYFVAQVQDTTERKQTEAAIRESEAKYRLIAENSNDLIASLSSDRVYYYVSPACHTLLGYTQQEMLARCLDEFLHPEDLEIYLQDGEACAIRGDRCTNIYRMRHKNGHYRWFESTNRYLKESDLKSIISISRDITERKKDEDAIARLNEELEARVKQRTAELETANQSLKAEIIERQRAERENQLLQNITQIVATADDFEDAISCILRKMCDYEKWDFGEAWLPTERENVLQLCSAWYSNSPELLSFREASLHFTFAPNIGLPGRVWATKEAEWIHNVSLESENSFLRTKVAQQLGLKTALGLPVVSHDKLIAVFVFYSHQECSKNNRTIKLLKATCAQLGLIMERKVFENALRSSMATNRALLDAIPDWIFRFSYDNAVVNYKASKNTPVPLITDNFVGKNIYRILPQKYADLMAQNISEALVSNEVRVCEYQLSKESQTIDYEARIAVSSKDEVMAIVRDITARKNYERDIHNALKQEKKLNELKSRFVSMTSHEFRTPLTSMLFSCELLELHGHKWSEDRKLNHLNRIKTSIKRMTELLNDVLLLEKADAGKLDLKPTQFDLYKFCKEFVEEIESIYKTHRIIFNVENSTTDNQNFTVSMDEKLLQHILNNLLSNAIKYSPDRDEVYFDLKYETEQVVFQVRDLGIGIPQEDRKHLFDSFHRASNVSSIPGTGLGLPIVKRAVDLYGGTITMQSQVRKGTTFTVTLPYLIENPVDEVSATT